MIAAGVHPKTLQTLMGHKDIRITMDTYGHLYEGAEMHAMDQFERFSARRTPHRCPWVWDFNEHGFLQIRCV